MLVPTGPAQKAIPFYFWLTFLATEILLFHFRPPYPKNEEVVAEGEGSA
jgi:hypothetical protein